MCDTVELVPRSFNMDMNDSSEALDLLETSVKLTRQFFVKEVEEKKSLVTENTNLKNEINGLKMENSKLQSILKREHDFRKAADARIVHLEKRITGLQASNDQKAKEQQELKAALDLEKNTKQENIASMQNELASLKREKMKILERLERAKAKNKLLKRKQEKTMVEQRKSRDLHHNLKYGPAYRKVYGDKPVPRNRNTCYLCLKEYNNPVYAKNCADRHAGRKKLQDGSLEPVSSKHMKNVVKFLRIRKMQEEGFTGQQLSEHASNSMFDSDPHSNENSMEGFHNNDESNAPSSSNRLVPSHRELFYSSSSSSSSSSSESDNE